ncbi:MAG: hypothetical protein ACTIM4_13490 [Marinomonas sp.]
MILLHSEKTTDLKLINNAVRRDVPNFISLDSLTPAIGLTGVTESSTKSTEQLFDRLNIKRLDSAEVSDYA